MQTLTEEELQQYDDFINHHARGHYLQSREWTKVKKQWQNELIIIRGEQGEIKASMSLLIRKVPILNKSILYCPRGPVYDLEDKKTFQSLMEELQIVAKKYKAFVFRMDPDICHTNIEYKQMLEKFGFKMEKKYDMTKVLQPKCVFRLNLQNKTEEEIFKAFDSKTRYNIRLAMKKGVKIKNGTREDLVIFHKMLKETGLRDHFYVRPLSYFEELYDAMYPAHVKLLLAEYSGEVIAGILLVQYANKVWYLYGASSNQYRNVMPNYLLQWEGIRRAVINGCIYYDFRGVLGCKGEKEAAGYGLYRFKKSFQPELMEFFDEFYIIYRPISNVLYLLIEKVYKNTMTKIVTKNREHKAKTAENKA